MLLCYLYHRLDDFCLFVRILIIPANTAVVSAAAPVAKAATTLATTMTTITIFTKAIIILLGVLFCMKFLWQLLPIDQTLQNFCNKPMPNLGVFTTQELVLTLSTVVAV